jgi:DNA polymerase (family 10)
MDCWNFEALMKNPIPLAKARRYAEQIAAALQPFCTRLEIAGSIRRERPYCGDIDIVAEPRDEAALRARILDGKEVVQNGPQNIHVRLTTGLEIQVFLARPETKDLLDTKPSNWGSLLLLRTGSREHNIFLTQTARANCMHWKVYEGLFWASPSPRGEGRGEGLIASATEEEIFAALHLKYVPPQKREIAASYHSVPTSSTFQ